MLIKCPECGKDVSDKAKTCIHCGFPLDNEKTKKNKTSLSNMPCPKCGTTWHVFDDEDNDACKICGYIFNNDEINLYKAQIKTQIMKNAIHCPNCNSTNVKPISGTERAVSVLGLGIMSKKINKSYKCLNCKYTW